MIAVVVVDLVMRLDGEEGGAGCARAPGAPSPTVPCVHISPVLSIHTLPAHGAQLPALGHEHDDEGDGGAGYQATCNADILIGVRHYQPGHYPDHPDGHREPDGQAHIHRLPVVLPHAPALEGEDYNHDNEEHDIEQTQELLLELSGAGEHHGLCVLTVPGPLHHIRGRGDQPLDPYHQLDQESKAEEEGLVGGGQVDPAIEGDEEHELDEESGVDQGVGQASAESQGGAGEGRGPEGDQSGHSGTSQQTQQQHLAQEQVAPARALVDGLTQEEDLEDDKNEDHDTSSGQDRNHPELFLEVFEQLVVGRED